MQLLFVAAEVEEKVKQAKKTEVEINDARENYRPGAARASLLYFILNDLNKIHPMYQFSLKVQQTFEDLLWKGNDMNFSGFCTYFSSGKELKIQIFLPEKGWAEHDLKVYLAYKVAIHSMSLNIWWFVFSLIDTYFFPFQSFKIVFEHSVKRAIPDEVLKNRVKNIIESVTYLTFQYTSRGLFEKHKIIFTAQVAFQVMPCCSLCFIIQEISMLKLKLKLKVLFSSDSGKDLTIIEVSETGLTSSVQLFNARRRQSGTEYSF